MNNYIILQLPPTSSKYKSHSSSTYLLLNLLRWLGFKCNHGASKCLYSTNDILGCLINFIDSIPTQFSCCAKLGMRRDLGELIWNYFPVFL